MEAKKKISVKILLKGDDGNITKIEGLFPLLDFNRYSFEDSESPDFLIHDQLGREDFTKYDCVRISYDRERHTPDFNLSDYAISDDIMDFGDRYFCMPELAHRRHHGYLKKLHDNELKRISLEELQKKEYFCNFIYSNELANNIRTDLYNLLSEYKMVHSGGKMYNNIGYTLPFGLMDNNENIYAQKIQFLNKSKFTLAIENTSYPGYTTEKLLHAFVAETIPIYWGDPCAKNFFNKDAYIDVLDYKRPKDLLNRIEEIDKDDELYLSIINKKKLNPEFEPLLLEKNLCTFIENIFDQKPKEARRRNREFYTRQHEIIYKKGLKIKLRKNRLNVKLAKGFKSLKLENTRLYKYLKRKRYY